MRPHWQVSRVVVVCAALAVALHAAPAWATLQFQKAFVAQYVEGHSDAGYAALVQREAKCNVCHQGCKDRRNLNAYGQELGKLLDHRADKDNVDKIVAALKTVADLPAEPSKSDGTTFGERIAAGKLPAGELGELKKEPAE